MVLLICACLAWAIMGAGKQLVTDTRSGVESGIAKIKRDSNRKAAQIRARGWRSPSRWALAFGTGAWATTKVTWRLSRAAGQSFRLGWAKGWRQGKAKHAAFVARRKEREQAAVAAWEATNGVPTGKEAVPGEPPAASIDGKGSAGQKKNDDGFGRGLVNNHDHSYCFAKDCEAKRRQMEAAKADQSDQQPRNVHPVQEGAEVTASGEAGNIQQTRDALKKIMASAGKFAAEVEKLAAGMATKDVDADTVGEVMSIQDAAQGVKASASRALSGLNRRHEAMEQAVNATPTPASTDFYKHQ